MMMQDHRSPRPSSLTGRREFDSPRSENTAHAPFWLLTLPTLAGQTRAKRARTSDNTYCILLLGAYISRKPSGRWVSTGWYSTLDEKCLLLVPPSLLLGRGWAPGWRVATAAFPSWRRRPSIFLGYRYALLGRVNTLIQWLSLSHPTFCRY